MMNAITPQLTKIFALTFPLAPPPTSVEARPNPRPVEFAGNSAVTGMQMRKCVSSIIFLMKGDRWAISPGKANPEAAVPDVAREIAWRIVALLQSDAAGTDPR
jgi:hypothetical protein